MTKDIMKDFVEKIIEKVVTVIGLDCMYSFSLGGQVTSIENVTVKYNDGTEIGLLYEDAKDFKIGDKHKLKVDR